MSSYNRFVMPVPEVVIPSKSYSSSASIKMSSTRSNLSSKDIDATFPFLMSPYSVLLESWVPLIEAVPESNKH